MPSVGSGTAPGGADLYEIAIASLQNAVNGLPPNYAWTRVTGNYLIAATDLSLYLPTGVTSQIVFPPASTNPGRPLEVLAQSGTPTLVPQGADSIDAPVSGQSNQYRSDGVGRWVRLTTSGAAGTTSPLTTKGDLWGFDTGDNRIPLSGSNGYVLTEDSTQALGVKWAALTSLSPNFPFGTPKRVSANYAVIAGDYAVFTTNAITVTLPAANIGADGYTVLVRNVDTAHTATVARAGADTIDGATSVSLQSPASSSPYVGAFFVSDGSSRWTAMFNGG